MLRLMLGRLSLRTILVADAVLTASVFAVVVGFGSARALRHLVIAMTLERHEQLARELAAEYSHFLALHVRTVETVAAQAAAAERFDTATLTPLVARANEHYSSFWGIGVTDPTGRLVAVDPPRTVEGRSAVGTDLHDRPWFRTLVRTGATVIDREVTPGRVRATPTVTVNAPIFDARGRFLGAVTGGLDLQEVQAIADRVRIGATGQASVATAGGTLFAHRDETYLLENLSALPMWRALAGDAGQVASYRDVRGVERLAGHATVPGVGWKVWVSQQIDDVEGEIWSATRRVFVWMLPALAAVLVTAVVLAVAISRPIRALEARASAFAQGALEQAAPEGGPKEVAALARGFNQMAAALRGMLEAERAGRARLERVVREYGALAARVARGDLAARAPVAEHGELGELGANLNRMAGELEARVRTLREATEREATARQEAESAARAKDEFLAALGHELRNPLAAITNAAAALRRLGAPDGSSARLLAIVERQVQHLARLVDDLLDVSRVTFGKIELQRGPVDLRAVAEGAVAGLRDAGRLVHHELTLSGEAVWVEGDAARLAQVVTNLLENAVKYTPAGGRIEVAAGREDGQARLSVRDTGIGIEPALLGRIFGSFVQAPQQRDRPRGGLGLGLALVHRIVQLHGGTVEARSDGPGRGSEFVVRLPAVSPPDPGPAGGAPARRAPGRRILIVEDNADARESLRLLLELGGHDVVEAEDGVRGLDLAVGVRPDLALVDVGLPGLDGYELARKLRATAEGRDLRLVALTGYGQPEDRRRALAAGFDAHLVKPVDPDRLAELLEALWRPPGRAQRAAGSPGT